MGMLSQHVAPTEILQSSQQVADEGGGIDDGRTADA
jgi:hypothetical protein